MPVPSLKPGKYAGKLYDSLALPGLAIAVAVDNQIVMTAEFGYSDVADRSPITPTSQFRIGSVSKLLTAAAMVRLAQSGKLDLDAPIGRYLPTLPPDKLAITARQLAGHLGGVRHYGSGEFSSQKHYESVGAGLGIFIKDTLLFPPGTGNSIPATGSTCSLPSWKLPRAGNQDEVVAMLANQSAPPFRAK